MTPPFHRRGDGIEITLGRREARLLAEVPGLLGGLGPAASDPGAARLAPPVYLGDPAADAEWRRLAGRELEVARAADRSAFALLVDGALKGVVASREEAEAFLRVVNEARLVLAARLAIDDPTDYANLEPEARHTLDYLGWVVTDLAEVLMELLD